MQLKDIFEHNTRPINYKSKYNLWRQSFNDPFSTLKHYWQTNAQVTEILHDVAAFLCCIETSHSEFEEVFHVNTSLPPLIMSADIVLSIEAKFHCN